MRNTLSRRTAPMALAAMLAAATLIAALTAAASSAWAGTWAGASQSLMARGEAAVAAGEPGAARLAFEAAIVADPKNADVRSLLGELHQSQGRLRAARRSYDAALSIDPNRIGTLKLGALADLAAEDLEGAEAKLARLEELCAGTCAEYDEVAAEVAAFKAAERASGEEG